MKWLYFFLFILVSNPIFADEVSSFSLEVNIPATRLYLYKNNHLIKTYPVAVGAPAYQTPVQSFAINQIIWNPGWFPPDSPWAKDAKPVPPGPNNPLGPVKFPLGDAVLIHGTNKPGSIGYAASHGCIRMNSHDAAELGQILQSELIPDQKENWENNFSKTRWKTVWLKLPQPIPVNTIYQSHKIIHDSLVLYRNPYGKRENILNSLVDYLIDHKIYSAVIDIEKLKNLRSTQNHFPKMIPIDELYSLPDIHEPMFAGICCTNTR